MVVTPKCLGEKLRNKGKETKGNTLTMMPSTLAPRDGRATLDVTTDRRHAEHRVETRDGAIEIVWTEGYDSVLLVHDDRRQVALDLTPSQVFSLLAGLTKVWERTRGQVGA